MLAQIIENRLPALRIALGRDEAARLMKQKEPRLARCGERLAVDGDLVIAPDVDRRVGQRDAVQRDAAFADPSFRVAARAGPARAMTLAMRSPVSWPVRVAALWLKRGGRSMAASMKSFLAAVWPRGFLG